MCGTTYQVDGYMVLCHKISTGIVTTLTCKSFDHSSSAPRKNTIFFTTSTKTIGAIARKMMYTSINSMGKQENNNNAHLPYLILLINIHLNPFTMQRYFLCGPLQVIKKLTFVNSLSNHFHVIIMVI